MVIKCSHCAKVFKQTKALNYHIEKAVCMKEFKCELCGKTLKTQNSLNSHKTQFCKMNPKKRGRKKVDKQKDYAIEEDNCDNKEEQEQEQEREIREFVPISREELFNIIRKMQEERDQMKKEMEEKMKRNMEEQIKKLRSELTTTNVNNGEINNNNNKTINNNNQININQINNNQTINIVGFGKEDTSKLNKNEVFRCLKSGLCYPTEMTIYVNFNKDFPENHNIRLSNVRDSNIKYYDGEDWNTIQYDDFYDNMVERQMLYVSQIKENKDIVYERLPPITKKILEKIEDLENIDAGKYKQIKQKFRNKIIDKRDLVAKTQKMIKA